MAEKWLTHKLEFLNSEGTTRFRLDKPTAGSPIILTQAPAGDDQASFCKVEKVKSKYAIPVLSLLAIDAANRGDGLKNARIYSVAWQNGDLYAPMKRSAINPKRTANRIQQEIHTIRTLVGGDTVLAIQDGYRLTVDVKPISSLKWADSGGSRESEPAQAERSENDLRSSPPLPATARPSIEPQESPINPAEMRAEARVRLTGYQTPSIDPGAANLVSLLARLATGVVFSGFLFWLAFRHLSPAQLRRAGYYGLFALVILFAVALAAIVARRFRKPRSRLKDKITILVAQFGADELSKKYRERIIVSIGKELETNVAEVLPAEIQLNLCDGDQACYAARDFLKRKGGDVLIWGAPYPVPGMRLQLDIRFSTSRFDHIRAETFEFTERGCLLDAEFAPELGTAIAAVATSMALPTVHDSGAFLSAVLKPAADKLSKLVQGVGQMYAVDRGALLLAYGQIQLTVGAETEDEGRIQQAVGAFRSAIVEFQRRQLSLFCALAQNALGHALLVLGEREPGSGRLEEAITAFQAALDEWKGDDQVSLFRTAVQNNLGWALTKLGERESGSERLNEGLRVLRAALEENTLEQTPFRRGMVLNNLGTNLLRLGQRESEVGRLKDAVEIFRSAIGVFERDREPLHWSMAQNNLANALTTLCEREGRVDLLEEAVHAFQAASEIRTRDRMPASWASIQINLGSTLVRIGELQNGTSRLNEAVTVTQAALLELKRDRGPLTWAMAQNTLGLALMKLGEREDSILQLEAAANAFENALKEWTRERVPFAWAMTKNSFASTLVLKARLAQSSGQLREAIECFREAAEECTRDRDPQNWAFAQNSLGVALLTLGLDAPEPALMEQAVATFRGILEEWTNENAPAICKMVQGNLDLAMSMVRERTETATKE